MNWLKSLWKSLTEPSANPPIAPPESPFVEPVSNFTPRAQQALFLARKEADRFNHNVIGTEHLLLGLIKLGQGTAVTVLRKMGLDLETVRRAVEKKTGTGPDQKVIGNIPYTPRVKKVLALASKEAKALNHTYVGTEHILLGLLREGDCIAAQVLKDLDVNIEQTRQEILKELDPNFTGKESAIPERPQGAAASKLNLLREPLGTFTPRAQQVLALARKEADRLHHNFIDSEHLLLGLIALGGGVAVNVLGKLGLNLDTVRAEVKKVEGPGSDQENAGNVPYTPRVKKVLELATKEARALNHTYVGTEHILLGLLREGGGTAGQVLVNLGVDLEKTRQEILKELDPNFPSATGETKTPPAAPSGFNSSSPQGEPVDIRKRYDVHCTDWSQGVTVYQNVRFKGIKNLLERSQYDPLSRYVELELSDGQSVFVSRSSIIKFCEHGVTPGSENVSGKKE